MGDAATVCPKCGQPAPAPMPTAATAPPQYGAPPPTWAPAPPPGGYPAYGAPLPKKKRSVGLVLLVVVVVAVVAFFGVVAGVAVFGNNPPAALDSYLKGNGTAYASEDHFVQVRLPESPTIDHQTTDVGGASVNFVMALVQKKTYEFLFAEYHFPKPLPPTEDALGDAIQGGATAGQITLKRTEATTLFGYPAEHGVGTRSGDQVELLAFGAHGNMYVIAVHTKKGAAKVMAEFEKSVTVSK